MIGETAIAKEIKTKDEEKGERPNCSHVHKKA